MSDNWEKSGGLFCSRCHGEVVRLINGLCPRCHGEDEKEIAGKMAMRAEKRYFTDQLRKGTISLADLREGRLGDSQK